MPETAERARNRFAAGPNALADLNVGEAKVNSNPVFNSRSVGGGQFQNETRDLFWYRRRAAQSSEARASLVIAACKHDASTLQGARVTSEELHKINPIDRCDPAHMQSLCRYLVWNSSQRGSQAYNFTRLCNAKKESFAVGRIDCELYSTFEEKKDFVRFLLLPE